MSGYIYRENINNREGGTLGFREVEVPESIVKQIRTDAIDECIKMTTDEKLCQIFEQLKEQ